MLKSPCVMKQQVSHQVKGIWLVLLNSLFGGAFKRRSQAPLDVARLKPGLIFGDVTSQISLPNPPKPPNRIPGNTVKPREAMVERGCPNVAQKRQKALGWIPMELFGKEQDLCRFDHLNF